jgi:hypothetical protein
MTPAERQNEVVKVLILLELKEGHNDRCPAQKNPEACNCHLLNNAQVRAKALDKAGLLRGLLLADKDE